MAVFTFFENSSEDRHGGWWAVVAPVLISVCCLLSTNRYSHIQYCVKHSTLMFDNPSRTVLFTCTIIGIGGLIVLCAALIIDVIGYWRFSLITGCVSSSDGKMSGSTDCGANFNDDGTIPQCVCSSDTSGLHCYSFDLTSGNNCSTIMTTYPNALVVSVVFLCVIAVLTVTYVFIMCRVACVSDSVRNARYARASAADIFHHNKTSAFRGDNDGSTRNPCPRESEGIEMPSLPVSLQSLSTSDKQRRAVSIGEYEESNVVGVENGEEEEEEEVVFGVNFGENRV